MLHLYIIFNVEIKISLNYISFIFSTTDVIKKNCDKNVTLYLRV